MNGAKSAEPADDVDKGLFVYFSKHPRPPVKSMKGFNDLLVFVFGLFIRLDVVFSDRIVSVTAKQLSLREPE